MKDLSAEFYMMDCLSPEVLMAQRMAELKDIAEYRQRHLREIKDWSDPIKREKKIAKAKEEELKARQETVENAEKLAELFDKEDRKQYHIKEK